MLAIAVLTPLRAFAQTPPPADAPPPPPPPPAVEAAPMPPPPPPAPPAVAVAAPMAPAAAPAAPSWKDLITVEGLADAYYQYNFTGGPGSLVGPIGQRNFDLNSNTFTLNYAKVGIGVNADPVGLRLDLGYGATGAIINAANFADTQVTSTGDLVSSVPGPAGVRVVRAGQGPDDRFR